uniref:DSBA-like thioredoxin domain-containing protein n=1 Tax=Phaeomonas parva TaxID=124430 RepID=A0A6U4L230_9STRA|mmetsp:Transcript_8426/g.24318  ORF Transcript_8426/g.24318 Transcript_8426/m.24318 type:complete len:121 (+) Transcript_8426:452-814(+)
MVPQMAARMATVGVDYSMGGNTGNSIDSHRLLTWCHEKHGVAKQNELVEELFLDYFSRERFLGDAEVLRAAAQRVGLGDEAEEVLGEGKDDAFLGETLQQYTDYTRRLRITGAPTVGPKN